jgi:hypothetical protein
MLEGETMSENEFRSLLETTSGYEIFLVKAQKFHEAKNEARRKREKWDDKKIQRVVKNMWEAMIEKLYSQIDEAISYTRADQQEKWEAFLAEHDVLNNFNQNMAEMEFDD